jgi:hypothetical protein
MKLVCPYCPREFGSADAIEQHCRAKHSLPAGKIATPAVEDPICIECGATASLVGGAQIYPHRPDLYGKRFWLCACGAYCGCHGQTTNPLGNPAGPATRRARSAAHDNFDPIWKSRQMHRAEAYAWLSRELNIAPEHTHIGMMTAAQAWAVVDLCNARRKAMAA